MDTTDRRYYWDRFENTFSLGRYDYSELRMSDGYVVPTVSIGRSGTEAPVILITSPATTFLLGLPFARVLAGTRPLVAWDMRGAPYLTEPDHWCQTCTPERLARDVQEIISLLSFPEVHIVSICGAAPIVCRAIELIDSTVLSVVFVSPNRISERERADPFGKALLPLLFSGLEDSCARLPSVTATLQKLDPGVYESVGEELVHALCRLNVETEENVRRFALGMRTLVGTPDGSDLAGTIGRFDRVCSGVPCVVLQSISDDVVDPWVAVDGLFRSRSFSLLLHDRGGHFAFFKDAELLGSIIRPFLREHSLP